MADWQKDEIGGVTVIEAAAFYQVPAAEYETLKKDNELLREQVRRLMEVSQHSISEEKYLAEVGLYPAKT